jgi:hypothetical protein
MSHTTTIKKVLIKDTNALESAVKNLQEQGIKCELVRDQVPKMYYPSQEKEIGKCDYVLKIDGSKYDVGFKKDADGNYFPVFDEWANNIGSKVGASCPMPNSKEGQSQHAIGKLMQEYGKEAAINAATNDGYHIDSVETDEEGNQVLLINVQEEEDLY